MNVHDQVAAAPPPSITKSCISELQPEPAPAHTLRRCEVQDPVSIVPLRAHVAPVNSPTTAASCHTRKVVIMIVCSSLQLGGLFDILRYDQTVEAMKINSFVIAVVSRV